MKLRTVTYAQCSTLGVAVARSRELRELLKRGGASRKLVDAARALSKRIEGAHAHATRCRLAQQRQTDQSFDVVKLDTDQPATCPRCGTRTRFEELTPNRQRHVCQKPSCRHVFIGVWRAR